MLRGKFETLKNITSAVLGLSTPEWINNSREMKDAKASLEAYFNYVTQNF